MPDQPAAARRTNPAPFAKDLLDQNAAHCTGQVEVARKILRAKAPRVDREQQFEIMVPHVFKIPAGTEISRHRLLPAWVSGSGRMQACNGSTARHIGYR